MRVSAIETQRFRFSIAAGRHALNERSCCAPHPLPSWSWASWESGTPRHFNWRPSTLSRAGGETKPSLPFTFPIHQSLPGSSLLQCCYNYCQPAKPVFPSISLFPPSSFSPPLTHPEAPGCPAKRHSKTLGIRVCRSRPLRCPQTGTKPTTLLHKSRLSLAPALAGCDLRITALYDARRR